MSKKQSRVWCFTLHGDEDVCPILFDAEAMNYLIYQREECPDTKRKHWQGYLEMNKKITLGGIKKKVDSKAHWEIRKGTQQEAIDYCTKDDSRIEPHTEYGTKMAQGQRTDLEAIAEDIRHGRAVGEILMENPQAYHQFGRTMEALESEVNSSIERNWQTRIVWIYGPTGVGKSRGLKERIRDKGRDPKSAYWHAGNDNHWWDNYKPTKNEDIILDDYRGNIPFNELLKMADWNPFTVPTRCRRPKPFVPKTMWITSCHRPETVYKNMKDEDIGQLYRRIENLIYLDENGTEKAMALTAEKTVYEHVTNDRE